MSLFNMQFNKNVMTSSIPELTDSSQSSMDYDPLDDAHLDTFCPVTGRPPIPLYVSWDHGSLSPYQVELRRNIELFEAKYDEVQVHESIHKHLPNKAIEMGQVGIRCIHCARAHPIQRSPGSSFYPSKRDGIYQAAQNLGNTHILENCPFVPMKVRQNLQHLLAQKATSKRGKNAWADRAIALGVYDDETNDGRSCLRFADRVNAFRDRLGELE